MSTLQNIRLKIDPKDLQIRTITVERLFVPLIIQVTTLVNCPKYPSNNKKGRSKRSHVLLKSVEEATLNLIEKGGKIARDTAVLKEELIAAVEEVRRENKCCIALLMCFVFILTHVDANLRGISLTRTAREFTENPCHLSKREAVVQAARALLAAVTRLLILADRIDVIFLLQYLTTVQKTFDFLRTTSNKAELKKANQKFIKELELLDKLAYKRQQSAILGGVRFPFSAASDESGYAWIITTEPINCKTLPVKAVLSQARRNDPQLLGGQDFGSKSMRLVLAFDGVMSAVVEMMSQSSRVQYKQPRYQQC
ncbi:UNVERIFIED_CONTAM: hypothetical protein FKN15_076505 [Acipenser sinensis]